MSLVVVLGLLAVSQSHAAGGAALEHADIDPGNIDSLQRGARLMARARGADYVYSFLKGFYLDPASPTGVNNTVLAGTSMPHVLWELQGYQEGIFAEHTKEGVTSHSFEGFELVMDGSMSPEEYDDFVRDTVNFLAYIAEPIRSDRRKLGVWVLMFLIFFWILASMLKKQIWKDVS